MAQAVDLLVSAGLLEAIPGVWGGWQSWDENGGQSSRCRVTNALLTLLQECGGSSEIVGQEVAPQESLVRLRPPKRCRGADLTFDETDDSLGWAIELHRYNQFIRQFDVDLEIKNSDRLALDKWYSTPTLERSRQPTIKAPELFNLNLVRIFNDGTFDHGGRLYHGWWIDVPSQLRKSITIDGERTAELDFSGMAVRMLYHQEDLDYREDPYEIAELASYAKDQGYKANHFRPSVKRLLQALLNGDDQEQNLEMIELEKSFRPKFSRGKVRSMIEEKHKPIAKAFGSKVGMRLQRLESDIALEIICELMEAGELVLPIHDSFIIRTSKEGVLNNQMHMSYCRHLRFRPVICNK